MIAHKDHNFWLETSYGFCAGTVSRLSQCRSGAIWPKYSEATARGNIVPPHCFIDMFLLLLLRDLHGLTTPWEILSGDNIAENDHIPPDLVVACVPAQRKPPEVRI